MAIDKTLLLNMLINSAPLLMQALSTPYHSPGNWYSGEDPLDDMFGHAKDLKMLQDRGYDMGLLEDQMLFDYKHNIEDMPSAAVNAISQVATTAQSADDLTKSYLRYFPSDVAQKSLNPTEIYNQVAKGYNTPALESAFAMLHGSQFPKRKPLVLDFDDLPF